MLLFIFVSETINNKINMVKYYLSKTLHAVTFHKLFKYAIIL